ncbi:sarcosine oxidase subunit gamma [Saccharopolyspora erythraea NRRL 2338]|uniref:Sarcosine oxidase gamma subunit n=2 Tax=Saccharopolyspora erythraea TaxID=1836 RepID=A4FI85_SACEN|nr:sarcosine oxidase subunit gamma family protein [Saccharopolyspora erythraea]EQD83214.1 sarcosine oxidase subunit gamma [Saccharopolyspora erythraea D]PFG97440.1 sarcosine oxidase subunit gamma [Saccharopolyspora erythraea NRRL 2338]QRK87619.1 sarcosine oxidase subunit gamma [Saccharopolyspora erythraea]CAM03760.1 sarcosine oxidase gamma subunit [Saccharopolyspora erythraea NRRL 2338]
MAEIHGASPLASRAELLARASVPGVLEISEVPFKTQITLRLDPKGAAAERVGTALGTTLPKQPGEVAVSGNVLVLWMGPDEWLLVAQEGTAEALQSTLADAVGAEHAAIVDVSAHRTIVDVAGSKAEELLNKGCALDLHPRSFETGRCAQTMLARAEVVLVRRHDAVPGFWVFVRSSFARYLADWLADAASEYGRPSAA